MSYELRAIYDSRKEFYGKAKVIENGDGIKTLRSYQTEVAYIKDGRAYVRGHYSATTGRHIREFLLQNGFTAGKWAQIEKDYGKPEEQQQTQPDDSGLGGMLKAVSMVCAIGSLECKTQEEKNAWDKRMLGTLPGASFPEDWDTLTEEEKTRRLEGAKGAIK